MNKATLFAASAALALCASGAYAAKPATSNATAAGRATVPAVHEPKLTVLYDQTTDDGGIAIVSQMFESTYQQYDSQGADDFTVPQGSTWTIKEIVAVGQYFNGSGPATGENVFFYTVKKGLPKKKIAEYDAVKGKDSSGSFTIKLKPPMVLKAGTYSLSVQAVLAFSQGGEWGWENTSGSTNYGNPADWQNPGNGFATGCTKYEVETTCIPSGEGPDHLFKLLGSSK